MGLKKIALMRDELNQQAEALGKFTTAAKAFSEAHKKIIQAYENLEKLRKEQYSKVQALDTLGISEFAEYKKELLEVFAGWTDEPPPTSKIEGVVAQKRRDVDKAVQDRVNKLAASFPSQIKPGMVFRFEPTKTLREITKGPTVSQNINLKGDAKIWYDYKEDSGGTSSTNLETLKKNCKYIAS